METEYMLRVRAVVMTRDDSSGGWVPVGGGGLSHVTIAKGHRVDDGGRPRHYLIRGERLRDQATILECALRRDVVYNKVNPIFHHWRGGDGKFGLTFQSPADAAAFETRVQAALDELARGSLSPSSSSSSSQDDANGMDDAAALHTDSESSSNSRKEMLPKPGTIVTSESSSSCYVRSPASEDFPFGAPAPAVPPAQVPLQPLSPPAEAELLETLPPCPALWGTKGYEDYRRAGGDQARAAPPPAAPPGPPPAAHFAKAPRPDPKASPACRIRAAPSPPKPPKEPRAVGPGPAGPGEEDAAPPRCVYCRDVFSTEENGRGRCADAPDPAGRCVYQLSCLWCAESLLYHCMSDAEGDFSDPCSCDPGHPHFALRWLALVALSLAVPCLCCYLPLRACYWCGGRCGCCGGRHKAAR